MAYDHQLLVHKGGCFCTSVTYQVEGLPILSAYCHCTLCQRLNGTYVQNASKYQSANVHPTLQLGRSSLPSTSPPQVSLGLMPIQMLMYWNHILLLSSRGRHVGVVRNVVVQLRQTIPSWINGVCGVHSSSAMHPGISLVGILLNPLHTYSTRLECLMSKMDWESGQGTRINLKDWDRGPGYT